MKKIIVFLGAIIMLFTSCNEDGSPSSAVFIISPECGSQLTDISQSIFCRQPPNEIPVYGYRFIVTNEATGILAGIVDTPVNSFQMVDIGLNNIALNTIYKIEVKAALDPSLNYTNVINPACTIKTPALPEKSRVIIPQCGSVVDSFWTNIFAKQTLGAEKYRFVITFDSQTRVIETTESRFQLSDLPGGPVANTQYFIRVDILYQGTWYSGDDLCSIITSPTASYRHSSDLLMINNHR
jgi:hypothetical protein